MKNNFLIQSIVFLTLGLVSVVYAGNEGAGGGGIERITNNGIDYLTIGDIWVKIEREPIQIIPGMDTLSEVMDNFPVDSLRKSMLRLNTVPSAHRRYYKVDKSELPPGELDKLLEEYKTLFQNNENIDLIPGDKPFVYAITNPETKETFLLPKFYQLTNINRQVEALWHESLRVFNKKYRYASADPEYLDTLTVVRLEAFFSQWLRHGNGSKFFRALNELLNGTLSERYKRTEIQGLFIHDLKNGNLDGFAEEDGGVILSNIFQGEYTVNVEGKLNFTNIQETLIKLGIKYPKSEFIAYLLEGMTKKSLIFPFVSRDIFWKHTALSQEDHEMLWEIFMAGKVFPALDVTLDLDSKKYKPGSFEIPDTPWFKVYFSKKQEQELIAICGKIDLSKGDCIQAVGKSAIGPYRFRY